MILSAYKFMITSLFDTDKIHIYTVYLYSFAILPQGAGHKHLYFSYYLFIYFTIK